MLDVALIRPDTLAQTKSFPFFLIASTAATAFPTALHAVCCVDILRVFQNIERRGDHGGGLQSAVEWWWWFSVE